MDIILAFCWILSFVSIAFIIPVSAAWALVRHLRRHKTILDDAISVGPIFVVILYPVFLIGTASLLKGWQFCWIILLAIAAFLFSLMVFLMAAEAEAE